MLFISYILSFHFIYYYVFILYSFVLKHFFDFLTFGFLFVSFVSTVHFLFQCAYFFLEVASNTRRDADGRRAIGARAADDRLLSRVC